MALQTLREATSTNDEPRRAGASCARWTLASSSPSKDRRMTSSRTTRTGGCRGSAETHAAERGVARTLVASGFSGDEAAVLTLMETSDAITFVLNDLTRIAPDEQLAPMSRL